MTNNINPPAADQWSEHYNHLSDVYRGYSCFEFWSLVFVLVLFFGAWNFNDFYKQLTQFISHPALAGWEFKRFYRYRESMFHGCKFDRCRRLMNWNKIFFAYFLQVVGMRQQNNQHQIRLKQIRYLPEMNRSSSHQKPTDPIKQRLKKNHQNIRGIAVAG